MNSSRLVVSCSVDVHAGCMDGDGNSGVYVAAPVAVLVEGGGFDTFQLGLRTTRLATASMKITHFSRRLTTHAKVQQLQLITGAWQVQVFFL